MVGSPVPTHTAVSSPTSRASWGYSKLRAMSHPPLTFLFTRQVAIGCWTESCKTRLLGAERLCGTWEWEGRKRKSVSTASQLRDLERVTCFSEPCVFTCQTGTAMLHGQHEKAKGAMVLRHWQLRWPLLHEAGVRGRGAGAGTEWRLDPGRGRSPSIWLRWPGAVCCLEMLAQRSPAGVP